MHSSSILAIILVIVSVGYAFEQILDYLNLKSQRPEIPGEMEGYYDREKYGKSQRYHRELAKFGFLTSTLSFVVSFLLLWRGGFGWIDGYLRGFFDNEIILALAFFGVIGLGADLLGTPFQWYSIFVIEEKYGFNKTTPRTFVADKLKSYLLAGLVGGALLSVLILLVERIGPAFWIWFWVLAALFILLVNLFYTSIILPLFNKLTPLPDGELRSAIESFASRVNFPLANIFTMDGSRRSSKANAFFSGMGKRKKIVLYDTLITNHSKEELVAVLAHEIGHYKKRHIIFGYILSVLQVGITLLVLSWLVFSPNVSLAMGAAQWSIHVNLLAFTILFSPLSFITGMFMKMYSRRNEFEADAYAKTTFDGTALAVALKRLSVDTLSNLHPHPAYVFFHYSHPPLLKRLAALGGNR